MGQKTMLKFINFWPPFWAAGISVKNVSDDFRSLDVQMKMRFWNKNYVGSHYGGSIYSMTDPFYMLMLLQNLDKDYIVWDKAANIRFLKPGYGKLTAHFNLTAEKIAEIKKAADENYKTEPTFVVQVKDEKGNVVAEVDKVLYVRRKDRQPENKPKP
jgi:acyl-coenzyme A thioesterase PaaI-like protein